MTRLFVSPPIATRSPSNKTYVALSLAAAMLAGCATSSPNPPPTAMPANVPAAWSAPLPHGGSSTNLSRWWQSLGDPVLVQLIEAAQAVSPGVASATSRIAQARAALGAASGANQPTLDASLSAQRGVTSASPTAATALQANLGAAWEVDLFGANRDTARAAEARLQGSSAQWHEARVSVAAETATLYTNWHTCQQLLTVVQQDAASRAETARLSALSAHAGLTAPAVSALARASAAEGKARVTQQKGLCDSTVLGLVALTALPEAELRAKLGAALSTNAGHTMPAVASVPAEVLAQRPDLYAAQREVAAASAELGSAEAQRYPRLTLSGSVGALNYTNAAGTTDLSTWSIGPVTLSLPILDGGRRAANVQAASARYTEAAALYQARVRQAVREVEEALLTLDNTRSQLGDAVTVTQGYTASYNAAEARYKAGSASLPELEEARRFALAAQTDLLQLQLRHRTAWIALYRALGGGWNVNNTDSEAKS